MLCLLEPRNETCKHWRRVIEWMISHQKRKIYNIKEDDECVPCYITKDKKEKKMQKDSALFESFVGVKHIAFSPLSDRMDNTMLLREKVKRSSIYSLTAAIYQTWESTQELRDIKKHMIEIIDEADLKLLRDNIKGSYCYKEIA